MSHYPKCATVCFEGGIFLNFQKVQIFDRRSPTKFTPFFFGILGDSFLANISTVKAYFLHSSTYCEAASHFVVQCILQCTAGSLSNPAASKQTNNCNLQTETASKKVKYLRKL